VNRADISAWEAAALVGLSFCALMTVGPWLAGHGLGGIVLGELLLVVAPTVGFIAARRISAAALGLDRAPPGAIVGGALFGAAAFYLVAVGLHAWIEHVWPTPPEVRRALERLVVPASGARPLLIDLAAFALVPAAAEELLFRGVLFGALRPRLGVVWTVLATAIAFGLYHGSVYRFLPAAFAGLLLGGVRAASGSLWPALAFHFANNAAVVASLHAGWSTPPARALYLAAAALATAAGLTLVVRSRT
jgi:sodium transport system permease protein